MLLLHILKDNKIKGQSTIEFIITFMFTFGIIFLFINLALNMTAGYMGHYITYKTSRIYLVNDNGSNTLSTVLNNAKRESVKEFNKFRPQQFLIKSPKFNVNSYIKFSDRKSKLFVGTYLKFKKKLSIMNFIAGNKDVNFISESFLGKEPPKTECLKRICTIMNHNIEEANACKSNAQTFHTLFDNGC